MITDPVQFRPGSRTRARVGSRSTRRWWTTPAEAIAAISGAGAGVGMAIHPDVAVEAVRTHLDDVSSCPDNDGTAGFRRAEVPG